MPRSTAVVTVNHKAAEDTALLLASLLKLENPPELVVVDNSADTINLGPQLPKYPFLKVIRVDENIGFGRGNNLGIRWLLKHSRCHNIFLVNNDAVVMPDTIDRLEAAMDGDRQVGIVAPRIRLMDAPDKLWYGGGHVNWFRGRANVPGFLGPAHAGHAMQKRQVTFASGCGMLVRRAVFETVGGFDPRFFMYEEDLEFCLRTSEAGWRILYCPEAVLLHKLHGGQSYRKKTGPIPSGHPENPNLIFFISNMVANRLLTMSLHARGLNALAFVFGFPLFFLYDGVRYGAAGRLDAVRAMMAAVAHFFILKKQAFKNELNME